jgi:hypothetical protein
MLLGGLWHGSSWNFVVWGLIHGLLLSIEKLLQTNDNQSILRSISSRIYTYAMVCLAWVFFRSSDLNQAVTIFENIIIKHDIDFYRSTRDVFFTILFVLPLGIALDTFLYLNKIPLEFLGSKLKNGQLIAVVCVLIQLIFLFYSKSENFIYFQF